MDPISGAALAAQIRAYRLDGSRGRLPVDIAVDDSRRGVWVLSAAAAETSEIELVVPCALDEHFVGLGEQFTQLDKRGRVFEGQIGEAANRYVPTSTGLDGGYKPAPLWYSSAGYAAFVGGTRRVRIEFAVRDPHEVVVLVSHHEVVLTVIEGWPADALRLVTDLTGRPPLAPPWAYGVWKGTRGGHDMAVAEADRLRSAEIPVSALWLDDHYQASTNSGIHGSGTYPSGDYPDMAGTVHALHERGYRVLTYVNPFLYRDTPVHDEAVARGFSVQDSDGRPLYKDMLHPLAGDDLGLLDATGLHSQHNGASPVDFTNPEARRWWQGLLQRILVDEGFDGWMADFGEDVPEGAVMADGTTALEAHNRYPLLYHSVAADEIGRTKPEAVFFARGGWLGAQGYAPAFWPGDQTRDWGSGSGLASVIPAGISLGLMGVAAWGPDIGGGMGFADLPAGYGGGSDDKELWMRWCQLGAMTPVMRDHLGFHSGTPVDLWTDEDTIACWRRAARWHVALFPYLYTAALQATETGLPVLRGLMLSFPTDPECWALTDQFMLGDALLCAPVVKKGLRTRRAYLPSGEWADWWTGERHTGPGWVNLDAPLDRWPVLQRAGTVVPLLADVPLSLNGGRWSSGAFDLDLRVVSGGREERHLFDESVMRLDGDTIDVTAPTSRRWLVTDHTGTPHDEGVGDRLTLQAWPNA